MPSFLPLPPLPVLGPLAQGRTRRRREEGGGGGHCHSRRRRRRRTEEGEAVWAQNQVMEKNVGARAIRLVWNERETILTMSKMELLCPCKCPCNSCNFSQGKKYLLIFLGRCFSTSGHQFYGVTWHRELERVLWHAVEEEEESILTVAASASAATTTTMKPLPFLSLSPHFAPSLLSLPLPLVPSGRCSIYPCFLLLLLVPQRFSSHPPIQLRTSRKSEREKERAC